MANEMANPATLNVGAHPAYSINQLHALPKSVLLLSFHQVRPFTGQRLSEAEHTASLVLVTEDQYRHALQVVLLASLALLALVAPVDERLASTV